MFEEEVQRYFHEHAITQRNQSRDRDRHHRPAYDQQLIIGLDDEGVAAAYSHYRPPAENLPEELVLPAGAAIRMLQFLGVAVRYRSQGGKFADQVVAHALWNILDQEPDAAKVYIVGEVDYRNEPSMAMLARAKFLQMTTGGPAPEARLGWWLHVLRRPQADGLRGRELAA
ncbi:hypothetical protein [Streptomyces sp. MS2.AVA.5]|uniref:Uncharacterized protein n=1 Tax=Streptomyces achmelvichensis TaxID=3134111 RepID=A0ACC6PM07_9ACTN